MKAIKLLTLSLISAFLLDYRIVGLDRPVRCDGDLIISEIRGHRVELFRWLK